MPYRRCGWAFGCGFAAWRHRRSARASRATHRIIWPRQCLRGTATPFPSRRRSSQSRRYRDRSVAQSSSARDQWRLLCHCERPRTVRCIYRPSPSPHAIHCRTLARAQLRASFKIAARDAATLCRSSRSSCEYSRTFLAPRIHPQRSRLRIPPLSRARRRNHEFFSARPLLGRVPRALREEISRHADPRPPPDRAGTVAHRKIKTRGIFSDRLGSYPLLPRAKYSGARPRVGRQQRRLLFPWHYRRRPYQHGTSL